MGVSSLAAIVFDQGFVGFCPRGFVHDAKSISGDKTGRFDLADCRRQGEFAGVWPDSRRVE